MARRRRHFLYFASNATGSHVKIGWTTNPWNRFSNLRCLANGLFGDRRIMILGVMRQAYDGEEGRIHDRLDAYHWRHEWFHNSPEVRSLIVEHSPRFFLSYPVERWCSIWEDPPYPTGSPYLRGDSLDAYFKTIRFRFEQSSDGWCNIAADAYDASRGGLDLTRRDAIYSNTLRRLVETSVYAAPLNSTSDT